MNDKQPTGATTHQDTAKGAAAYTRTSLAIYDLFVLGFSNSFAWNCPSCVILDFYNRHVSDQHLDVGVGTGYFLDRCRFPVEKPAIALLDLNQNSLAATAKRLRRYQPSCHNADVLQPIDAGNSEFTSIGMNYLLHCLPGDLSTKSAAFSNLKPLLRSGGVIFGATILGKGVNQNLPARTLSGLYNRKGIFSNREDTLPDLEAGLREHFVDTAVRVQGCVALFSGRKR
jgi:ubiquinone/menaquinone biosynthesis C-methylase UbiE